MNTLRERFTFLSEYLLKEGTEYIYDTRSVVIVSYKDGNYILTILGEYYIVTQYANHIAASLECMEKGIKIEPNDAAMMLRALTKEKTKQYTGDSH